MNFVAIPPDAMLVIFELLELFELFITVLQMFSNDEAPCRSTLRIPFITISTKSTLNKNHNISSPPFVLDSLIKNLQRSWLCAIIKSRDRVLRLNHLSFRLYSLAALGCSRSGFFNGVSCERKIAMCFLAIIYFITHIN